MPWRTIEHRLKGAGKAPSLKELAAYIEQAFPDLVAIVYPANHPLGGFCNTDRKITGTRLRRPGKGRRGSRLMVSTRPTNDGTPRPVFEHNAAETYRTNRDVVAWILRRRQLLDEAGSGQLSWPDADTALVEARRRADELKQTLILVRWGSPARWHLRPYHSHQAVLETHDQGGDVMVVRP